MSTSRWRSISALAAVALGTALIPTIAVAGTAPTTHQPRRPTLVRSRSEVHSRTKVRPGKWVQVGSKFTAQAGTPAVWQSSTGNTYMLWRRQVNALTQTYEAVRVTKAGRVSAPIDTFQGGHWESLSNQPTLLAAGKNPIVIFSGEKSTPPYNQGCVVGAIGDKAPWQLQPWSLTNDCVNPVGAAAENKPGVLASAHPNGHQVVYRIGTSPTIPATGSDSHISLSGSAYANKVGMTADAKTHHFYLAWAQGDSNRHDGYYVKDVTANTKSTKMPNTGTNAINHLGVFTNLAMASSSKHGIYLAGCNNASTCKPQLWRVGAKKAMRIPAGKNPFSVSISQGPGGRIWAATFDDSSQRVTVARSNRKVTRFGSARSYPTPCAFGGTLGLSGGSSSRLVIGMQCVNKKNSKLSEYVTETEAALSLGANHTKVRVGRRVTFTATDAGEAVSGAKVTFEGHSATTNAKGKAAIKATKKGKAKATVRAAGYAAGGRTIQVL